MSDLISFAYNEIRRAGLFDEDSDYHGMIGTAAMELVQAFADQGHSGASAALILHILSKVLAYEPLSPLTGEDDEWVDISVEMGTPMWQNKRCSRVFKYGDGSAYDTKGKVFVEPTGAAFTSSESRVLVTFPYTPKREYVNLVEESVDLPHSNC